ncbi:MAG: helix-turn-helix transcriptional regulator [Planctomycetes bacterium]|nr:helix-turn-helix transcriptional regulator [Planctomycetota bacterium]
MNEREPANINTPHGDWNPAAAPKDGEGIAGLQRSRYTDLNGLPIRFRLGSFNVEWLGWGFIDKSKWWRNYLHVHTYYEICYAFSGRGLFRMLGTDYVVKRGDVFIAKPREEHEIVSDEDDPLGIYFWSYTLVHETGPKPPERLIPAQERARDEALDRLLHAFVDSKHWVSTRVPGMERTLELLTEEVARREPGYAGVIESLTSKLVLDTARASIEAALPGEAVTPRIQDPAKAMVDQATRYMRDNLTRNLSIQDIAAQVNLSERHFTRLYTKYAKRSPIEALTAMRMESAAQLLLDRSLPIKEIAERAGYPDVRYFTTVFRKHSGLPPAQFRERGGTKFADPSRGPMPTAPGKKPGHIEKKLKRVSKR